MSKQSLNIYNEETFEFKDLWILADGISVWHNDKRPNGSWYFYKRKFGTADWILKSEVHYTFIVNENYW